MREQLISLLEQMRQEIFEQLKKANTQHEIDLLLDSLLENEKALAKLRNE